MSPITTHVLDTSKGKPAAGVPITIFVQQAENWQKIGNGTTNADGRVADLLAENTQLKEAVYRVSFDVQTYAAQHNEQAFYPQVDIVFRLDAPNEHYHIPLLLSAFGYSTYRGS